MDSKSFWYNIGLCFQFAYPYYGYPYIGYPYGSSYYEDPYSYQTDYQYKYNSK